MINVVRQKLVFFTLALSKHCNLIPYFLKDIQGMKKTFKEFFYLKTTKLFFNFDEFSEILLQFKDLIFSWN